MTDSDTGPGTPADRIAELIARPDAARWALDCGWVPGTGHCRNRPCGAECPFREQREAEASRVEHARRRRRRDQRRLAERRLRRN